MIDTRALGFVTCLVRGYNLPMISCLKCKRFPCIGYPKDWHAILESSPFVTYGEDSKLIPRRIRTMYIFKLHDGSLEEAPEGFDPNNPDFNDLADVDEVLVIGKELVKQVRLVPKPKEEQDRIKAAAKQAEPEPTPVEEPKKKRRKKSAA